MSEWKPVDDCPDDFERVGGQRYWRLRDRYGAETVGKRGHFNNSGWNERDTNRELWPVYFAPLGD